MAACSGGGPVAGDDPADRGGGSSNGSGAGGSSGASGSSGTKSSCTASGASIQNDVFKASCDGVGCHGSQAPAAGLDLVDTSPEALSGKTSALCAGWSLLVPGSPENSFLYQKVTATKPACGDVMPLGKHLPDGAASCIAEWISAMAAGCETCGGTECVALASDAANCGACNNACAAGVACENGACSCASGLTACASSCVDTSSDAAHCGACDTACAGKEVCLAGKCAAGCGSLAQCGSGCADLETDAANCGACGTKCGAGEACVGGACRCSSSASVSFKNDVAPILQAACTAAGCHAGMKPKENLALDAAKSYAELVGVSASQCGGARKLVVAGDPGNSYLMQKLLGTGICTGTQMPKAGQALPQKQLDSISGWICSGAPNN